MTVEADNNDLCSHLFEDFLRTESLGLYETLLLPMKTEKEMYIVGKDIESYRNSLSEYGFGSFYYVHDKAPTLYLKHLLYHTSKMYPSPNRTTMYAYIDYVLEGINADIVIFLPKESWLINRILSGDIRATGEEIIRTLYHFPERYQQIYFTTGLFNYTPKEFSDYTESWKKSNSLILPD